MAAQLQTGINWRQIARQEFVGFSVTGNGPFAVADHYTMTVQLFDHPLLANATGRKVITLQQPRRAVFRMPSFARDLR